MSSNAICSTDTDTNGPRSVAQPEKLQWLFERSDVSTTPARFLHPFEFYGRETTVSVDYRIEQLRRILGLLKPPSFRGKAWNRTQTYRQVEQYCLDTKAVRTVRRSIQDWHNAGDDGTYLSCDWPGQRYGQKALWGAYKRGGYEIAIEQFGNTATFFCLEIRGAVQHGGVDPQALKTAQTLSELLLQNGITTIPFVSSEDGSVYLWGFLRTAVDPAHLHVALAFLIGSTGLTREQVRIYPDGGLVRLFGSVGSDLIDLQTGTVRFPITTPRKTGWVDHQDFLRHAGIDGIVRIPGVDRCTQFDETIRLIDVSDNNNSVVINELIRDVRITDEIARLATYEQVPVSFLDLFKRLPLLPEMPVNTESEILNHVDGLQTVSFATDRHKNEVKIPFGQPYWTIPTGSSVWRDTGVLPDWLLDGLPCPVSPALREPLRTAAPPRDDFRERVERIGREVDERVRLKEQERIEKAVRQAEREAERDERRRTPLLFAEFTQYWEGCVGSYLRRSRDAELLRYIEMGPQRGASNDWVVRGVRLMARRFRTVEKIVAELMRIYDLHNGGNTDIRKQDGTRHRVRMERRLEKETESVVKKRQVDPGHIRIRDFAVLDEKTVELIRKRAQRLGYSAYIDVALKIAAMLFTGGPEKLHSWNWAHVAADFYDLSPSTMLRVDKKTGEARYLPVKFIIMEILNVVTFGSFIVGKQATSYLALGLDGEDVPAIDAEQIAGTENIEISTTSIHAMEVERIAGDRSQVVVDANPNWPIRPASPVMSEIRVNTLRGYEHVDPRMTVGFVERLEYGWGRDRKVRRAVWVWRPDAFTGSVLVRPVRTMDDMMDLDVRRFGFVEDVLHECRWTTRFEPEWHETGGHAGWVDRKARRLTGRAVVSMDVLVSLLKSGLESGKENLNDLRRNAV